MSTREWAIAVGFWGLFLGAAFAWWRSEALAPDRRGPLAVVGVVTDEDHLVTPEMRRASEAMTDRLAPKFRAVAHDATAIDSARLVGERPVVLVFIKDGCPCSASAEPFFARLHASYGGRAAFLGVIDGDPGVAAGWVADHGTPFPVLADPGLEIVRAFDVRNSAYVALVDRDGRIDALWPGYSEGILRVLSARLAALTGLPEADVGAAEAPELAYSGCPFDLDPVLVPAD